MPELCPWCFWGALGQGVLDGIAHPSCGKARAVTRLTTDCSFRGPAEYAALRELAAQSRVEAEFIDTRVFPTNGKTVYRARHIPDTSQTHPRHIPDTILVRISRLPCSRVWMRFSGTVRAASGNGHALELARIGASAAQCDKAADLVGGRTPTRDPSEAHNGPGVSQAVGVGMV